MIAERRARAPVVLPRPSTLDMLDDVPDLIRDPSTHVVISAGGRDQGPSIRRGPNGGKRQVHDNLETADVQYEDDKHQHRVSRKVDVLRDMFNRNALSKDDKTNAAMFADGLWFQEAFDRSHWYSSGGMRFDNMPVSGKVSTDGGRTDAIVAARREVEAVIAFLGGSATLGAIAMVQIIGHRKSLSDMARGEGDNRAMWKGAILAALGSLGTHRDRLGYDRRKTTIR